jgi:hypothetical protein
MQLRRLHLMESPQLENFITTYPEAGTDVVEFVKYDATNSPQGSGRVWINETQYFGNVPGVAWNFYIGGYQPAQKWLKDRAKEQRTLTNADIEHYQRIVVALVETDRLMHEIDKLMPVRPAEGEM